MNKGLVKLATIDCDYSFEIFLNIVSMVLKQLAKNQSKIDIIIYSGIEDRKIVETIYPF